MYYLPKNMNELGGYPNPQSTMAEDMWELTDQQTGVLVKYSGFVTIEDKADRNEEGSSVTVHPNLPAWERWMATQPSPEDQLAQEARAQRDKLLEATDWTQMGDCPLDDATQVAVREYRQALRNVPQQEGFPAKIQWPEIPAALSREARGDWI